MKNGNFLKHEKFKQKLLKELTKRFKKALSKQDPTGIIYRECINKLLIS